MPTKDTFTADVPREIIEDAVYLNWEEGLDGSLQLRVQAARDNIENYGLVTNVKDLGDVFMKRNGIADLDYTLQLSSDAGRRLCFYLGVAREESSVGLFPWLKRF